jgi:transcriptional regulator of acetoin/glycerol metabolism
LTLDDLPQEIREDLPPVYHQAPTDGLAFSDATTLEEMKKRYVLFVLQRCRGNMSRAAKILDVDRRSLYRMLARWKVEPVPER